MKFKVNTVSLLVMVVLCSAWAATSVSAHALLVRSNPAANAVLEQAPVQVEIFFSEPLDPQVSSISVLDSTGQVVDAGDVRVDPSDPLRITVTLHALPEGVYTVTWKALSTVDGHQSVGTFPFAVGITNADAVREISQSTTARIPFTALLSKFLLLSSLAVLIGQRLFIALIWDPALKSNQIEKPVVWNTLYHLGLIGVLISTGLGILSQAGQATGSEFLPPWSIHTGHILFQTRLGVLWLLRLALAMLAVWLAFGKASTVKDWLGFVVNLFLLLTVTLISHAATDARPFFPILGDWLHLVGMTFWLGGLVYLFTGIRKLQQLDSQLRTQLTSFLTSRFSINAIFFVSLIGVTGFYSAYLRVGSWSALLTSLYGHVLLVKQAFVASLLVIAAINLLVISPRLTRERLQGTSSRALLSTFGKILIVELTFAGLLLASVSFLTYVPPAKAPSLNSDLTGKARVDDLKLDLSISPGRVGQNTFALTVIASDGHPLHSAKEVLLRFTPVQGNVPPSELELIAVGDGTFTAKGVHLSLPGTWQVQAVIRREDKFDAFGDFEFALRNPGSAEEAATIPRQSSVLIVAIGLLCALLTASVQANAMLRLGAGATLTVLLVGLGIFYLNNPITYVEQTNPIPANSESIAAGQEIYSIHCASCHGATGKGDGPVGLTLNPRPADLTQHAITGIHPDSQLFEWITNGFPGSRMPAYRTALSDTDRWNLVNFIRTLAPK